MTALILHKGAQLVDRDELSQVSVPANTATWFPVSHSQVLDTTTDTLHKAGFEVVKTQLALTRDKSRFFGTLDLRTPIAAGVQLAVGIQQHR